MLSFCRSFALSFLVPERTCGSSSSAETWATHLLRPRVPGVQDLGCKQRGSAAQRCLGTVEARPPHKHGTSGCHLQGEIRRKQFPRFICRNHKSWVDIRGDRYYTTPTHALGLLSSQRNLLSAAVLLECRRVMGSLYTTSTDPFESAASTVR